MVAVLAGRRIDAPDASVERFPLKNVESVRRQVREALTNVEATALVCAAAAGADLIALEEAGKLGIRRRVVLPFAVAKFRETSVVDRPGNWGPVYDQVIGELNATGAIVVMDLNPEDPDKYQKANLGIIEEGERLARNASTDVVGIIVWDLKPRGDDDITAGFRAKVEARGHKLVDVGSLQ